MVLSVWCALFPLFPFTSDSTLRDQSQQSAEVERRPSPQCSFLCLFPLPCFSPTLVFRLHGDFMILKMKTPVKMLILLSIQELNASNVIWDVMYHIRGNPVQLAINK